MQDIQLAPRSSQRTFGQYFALYWDTLIHTSFKLSNAICIVFDSQIRKPSPKDITRKRRDQSGSDNQTIPVDEDMPLPRGVSWTNSFLKSRENKKNLVHFLCYKMIKESSMKLKDSQVLYLSFEDQVWRITKAENANQQYHLGNNHDEADTRFFFLAYSLKDQYSSILIRSTDSDILFVFLANADEFIGYQDIFIHYNVVGSHMDKYAYCNVLVDELKNETDANLSILRSVVDLPSMFSFVHFVSGGDDLCYLRHLTKNVCLQATIRDGTFIFSEIESIRHLLEPEKVMELTFLFVRFLASAYRKKYGQCFQGETLESIGADATATMENLDNVLEKLRRKTWQKSICRENTVPSPNAVVLHSRRISYCLQRVFNATAGFINNLDINSWGWFEQSGSVTEQWDTEEEMKKVDVLLQSTLRKCSCKSGCNPRKRVCPCRRTRLVELF